MPILLSQFRRKLRVRVDALDAGFRRHLASARGMRQLDRQALREGYVSALWQFWGQFVRSVLIESTRGALQEGGALTTSPFSAHTEDEIAYICMQLARRQSIGRVRAIRGSHLEPTWGDVDKAILIASSIGLSNQGELLSAFAIPTSLKDLQLCRNAAAHLGASTFAELKLAKVRYTDTRLLHPTDAVVWVDNATCGYLWDTWVDEIMVSADYACR